MLPEISDLGTASWKILGLFGISKLEVPLQGWSICKFSAPSNYFVFDHWCRDGNINRRSFYIAMDFRSQFHRLEDAWREGCVCTEKDHHECAHPKESQCRRATCSKTRPTVTRKADSLHDLRILSVHLSVCSCTRSIRSIQYTLTESWRSRFRHKMGPLNKQQGKDLRKGSWKVQTSQNVFTLL